MEMTESLQARAGFTDVPRFDVIESHFEGAPIEHHSFSPKAAVTNFRQHVQISGSKSRQKRGNLAELYDESSQHDSPKDTEELVSPVDENLSPGGQAKKMSLGRNLVGSIRTMTAKHTWSPPRKDRKENIPPQSVSAISSPTTPPTLTVDIGTGEGLVPNDFGRGSFTSQENPTPTKSITTRPLKQKHSIDVFGIGRRGGPSTDRALSPISDGNSENDDSKSEDIMEVFERSVLVEESKSLKRMISLDAMAERCTQDPNERLQTVMLKANSSIVPDQRHPSTATTIHSCPSDMEEISRQPARAKSPTVLLEGQVDGKWSSDDPFAPGTPSIKLHGPDTELPFRPKFVPQEVDEPEMEATEDLSSLDGHIFKSRSAAIISSSPEQEPASFAEKHRSMVSEVLEIPRDEWEDEVVEVPGVDDSYDYARLDQRQTLELDQISQLWIQSRFERVDSVRWDGIDNAGSDCPSNMADTSSPPPTGIVARHSTPARSERSDGSHSTLQHAILDNYDLQVALGGVDIVCDDKLRSWLDESADDEENEGQEHGSQEQHKDEERGDDDPSASIALAIKAHWSESPMYDANSDTSESINTSSVLETKSRHKEDSLDEALDMYRSYSAENDKYMADGLMDPVESTVSPALPTSPASPEAIGSDARTTRKPLPVRYRSVRSRKG